VSTVKEESAKFIAKQNEILKKISDGLSIRIEAEPHCDRYLCSMDEICIVLSYEVVRLENKIAQLIEFLISKGDKK